MAVSSACAFGIQDFITEVKCKKRVTDKIRKKKNRARGAMEGKFEQVLSILKTGSVSDY